MQPTLVIEAADPLGDAALSLLHEAALEARALYPEHFASDSPLPTNVPTPPRGVYIVATLAGAPVGCGALRPIDHAAAEVRRMYVLRSARRHGVARALLARLEREAIALGYRRLLLQTGDRQQPAMALYAAAGFRRIAPFGEHVDDPTSVCFAKALPDAAPP